MNAGLAALAADWPAPPPRTALVVALRYLGDVLLTTPVARALKERFPECAIDMLVFSGTEGMLAGNPDLRAVIACEEHAPWRARLALARRLWRRYDLAVVTSTGDRPVLFGAAAARRRVGLLPPQGSTRRWKSWLLDRACEFDPLAPRAQVNDRLAHLFGAAQAGVPVAPTAGTTRQEWCTRLGFDPWQEPFAVVHPAPRVRYKRWHAAGWRAAIEHLTNVHGLRVVVTGGPAAAERAYLDEVLAPLAGWPLVRLDGQLSLAQTGDLLRLARVFLGPDTGTTHLAVACATPTVTPFGPTDPVVWGPLPIGEAPYERVAPVQRRGSVRLLQNPDFACVPCQLEGCARHRDSHADCLDRLAAEHVLAALDELCTVSPDRSRATPPAPALTHPEPLARAPV